MKKILVIGAGKWGKIVIKKLQIIADVKHIINSKKNYKNIDTKLIDWVFVLTPDKKHFAMVNFFLKKGINIFCEKPLTTSYKKSKQLIKIAKENKKKLYIDDIENYKKIKIKIKKKNYIIRTKKDSGSIKSILSRLTYHDMYFLYPIISRYKKLRIKIISSRNYLNFLLFNKRVNFNFFYSLKSNNKEHTINNISLSNVKVDVLTKMLITVLYKKPNYKKNHEASLFASKMIENVKERL
jgi:hypothetical protein